MKHRSKVPRSWGELEGQIVKLEALTQVINEYRDGHGASAALVLPSKWGPNAFEIVFGNSPIPQVLSAFELCCFVVQMTEPNVTNPGARAKCMIKDARRIARNFK